MDTASSVAGAGIAAAASNAAFFTADAPSLEPEVVEPFLDKQITRSWTWVFSLWFLIIIFLSSQKTKLHFSRTLRRGIWATISTGFLFWTISILQALDFGSSLWDFGIVCAAGIVIASLIEDHLQRRYYLVPWAAKVKVPQGTPEAIGKADYVSTLIDHITSGLGATVGLAQVVARAINVRARRLEALHDVLNSADEGELNFMLGGGTINCAALVEVAKAETMQMLTALRLHELSIPSRAALLDGLMKVGMRNRTERQHFALNIILSTYGSDLTFLKGLIDDGGDHHIMYKLVYNDLQNRNQVDALQHISTEGGRARDAFRSRTRNTQPGPMLKIVSDIDDTLMSSGGAFPAGCDRQWPRRCLYPGVLAFFSEMDIAQALRVQAAEGDADADTIDGDSVAGTSDCGDASGSESMGPTTTTSGSLPWSTLVPQASGGGIARGTYGRFGLRGVPTGGRRRGATARSGLLGTSAGEDLGLKDLPEPSDIAEVLQGANTSYSHPSHEGSRGGFRETIGEAVAGARALAAMATRLAGKMVGARVGPLTLLRPRAVDLQPAVGGGDCVVAVDNSDDTRPHQPGANLVFLSARPESYEGTTEAMSFSSIFSPLIRRSELHCSPVLLLGSIASGPRSMVHYAFGMQPKHPGIEAGQDKSAAASFYTALAGKKLVRFQQYAALFPEAAFVFVGDNGQGDVLVAEALSKIFATMADRDGGPNRLCASFVHDVVPPPRQPVSGLAVAAEGGKDAIRAAHSAMRIFSGATYVGLAIQAHNMGLLDLVGLQHVTSAACKDLRWARCRYAMEAATDWPALAQQINNDIRLANQLLPAELQVSAIKLPGSEGVRGDSHRESSTSGPFAAVGLPPPAGTAAHHHESAPSSSGGSSPTAGGHARQRPAGTLTALRHRMTAAPLRTPPASPARAAALHTNAALQAWSEGGLGAVGRGGSIVPPSIFGSSPPLHRNSLSGMASAASGGGPSAAAVALGDRQQRGSPGLPPLPQGARRGGSTTSEGAVVEGGPGALAAAAATAAVHALSSGRLSPAASSESAPRTSQPSELTSALQHHSQTAGQPRDNGDAIHVSTDGRRAANDQVASVEPTENSDATVMIAIPH